jgi:hypothetical protein
MPNNVLAQKLKNDLFDKLISCSSEEQVQDTLLSLVREKIEDGSIDVESIRTLESVNDAATLLYACSINQQAPNFANISFELSDALQEVVSLLCNLPHFDLPELSFRFQDLHEGIIQALIQSLLQFAIQLLISLMTELLQIIIDFCNLGASSLAFGAANLINILEQSASGAIQNIESFLETVFGLFGIKMDGNIAVVEQINPDICIEDQVQNNGKSAKQFLNDVSMMLTPSEICSLINGNPTNETLDLLEEIIEFDYSQFKSIFINKERLILFFKTLGRIVDPKICEKLESLPRNENLCVSEQADNLRTSFLIKKGISTGEEPLTKDQIKTELEKERNRNKSRLERVAETMIAIKKSPNSIFDQANKQLFCENGKKGLISPRDIPVLVHSSNKTIDKTFTSVIKNYAKEINNIQSSFILNKRTKVEGQTIQKYTSILYRLPDGTEVSAINTLNPEFVKATAAYAPEYCDIEGNTDFESLKDAGYLLSPSSEAIDIQKTENDETAKRSIRILKYSSVNSLAPNYRNSILPENINISYYVDSNTIKLVYDKVESEDKQIIIGL